MTKNKGNNNIDLFSSVENEPNVKPKKISGGVIPEKPYHFLIENMDKEELRAVLFGYRYFSKHVNYGSHVGVFVNPADANTTMLELFEQSAAIRFRPKGIKIIADNWDVMPESLYWKDIELGEYQNVSLVDGKSWGTNEILGKAVNDVPLSKIIITDTTKMILSINPLSKIEVLFY